MSIEERRDGFRWHIMGRSRVIRGMTTVLKTNAPTSKDDAIAFFRKKLPKHTGVHVEDMQTGVKSSIPPLRRRAIPKKG